MALLISNREADSGGHAMIDDGERWESLIRALRGGDRQVTQDFCARYGTLLYRVARKHLRGSLRRRVGPEDVAQSACRTFIRRAQGGQFQLADRESLWQLLCAITLTKLREQKRFHGRRIRGLDREVPLTPANGEGDAGFQLVAPGPSPDEAAEFADQFQHLLAALDNDERQLVDLKLQEYTNDEVAERLGCAERTVRRILNRVKVKLARAFEITPPSELVPRSQCGGAPR